MSDDAIGHWLNAAGRVPLLTRATENGVTEAKLATQLRINATVYKWVTRLALDAITYRIELDGADDDLAEQRLRWVRS